MKVTLSLFLLAILLVSVIADSSSSEEKRPQKNGKNRKKFPKDRVKADNDMKPFDFDPEGNTLHHIHHFRPGFPGRPMFRPGGPHGPHRRPPHRRPRPPRPDFFPQPDQQGEQQQPIISDLGELGDYLDGDNGAVVDGGRRPLPGITKPTLVLIKPNGQIVAIPQKLLQWLKPQKEQQQQQQQQPSIVVSDNAEVSEINKIPEGGHVADIDTDINLTGQIGVTTGTE